MKRNNLVTEILALTIMMVASSVVFAKSTPLTISKPVVSSYRCEDGSKIKVSFYSLTDHSLSFVKLKVDGKNYTLPQVVSASGVRYTDLRQIELFTKGKTALLNKEVYNDKAALTKCNAVAVEHKK